MYEKKYTKSLSLVVLFRLYQIQHLLAGAVSQHWLSRFP